MSGWPPSLLWRRTKEGTAKMVSSELKICGMSKLGIKHISNVADVYKLTQMHYCKKHI